MADERLPIWNGDLFTSMLGVMRFPSDLEKAETYACWRLTRPAALEVERPKFDLASVIERASSIAFIADEVRSAEERGTAVGAITATLWNEINTSPLTASWERSIERAERYAQSIESDAKLSRSSAHEWRREFRRVFHYWGALMNNHGAWPVDPAIAVAQAEIILISIRKWNVLRGVEVADDAFRAPIHIGKVPMRVGKIPKQLLVEKKRSGRPKKPRP